MDWMNSTFWPAFRDLFWNLVRTPPEQRDPQATETSRAISTELLGYLDAHLANHVYIAGDAFTVGDIPMGCAIWRWMSLPIERPEYPALGRWFDTLGSREPYRKVVMKPLT